MVFSLGIFKIKHKIYNIVKAVFNRLFLFLHRSKLVSRVILLLAYFLMDLP